MDVCAKFRCAPLRVKKALGIFRELITTTTITTTTTTTVAFLGPAFRVQKYYIDQASGQAKIIWCR